MYTKATMLRTPAILVGCTLALGACGGAATPAPVTPAQAPPAAPAAAPATEPKPPASDVPPPPDSCKQYPAAAPEPIRCPDLRAQLADALTADAAARDAAIAKLEGCGELVDGVVRALRIDLLPVECGDALAEPWLARPSARQNAAVFDALRGLALAAQAHRLVRDPPELAPPHDKPRVLQFMEGTLADWIRRQAAAVYRISVAGSALSGYGKGVVAVEAGLADMRFVEVVRAAPVPDEIAKDPELAEAYYASLDQSLEPRKARGRDAALVGLGKLAEVGVLVDPRLARARALLSKVYAGRRIDALDALVLPKLPPAASSSPEETILANVPSFHAPLLLGEVDPSDERLLRALMMRGLPAPARARLDGGKLSAATERLYARALFELGRTYWRSADFAHARELAARRQRAGADMPLVAALSEILAKGPKNAAEMMLAGPHLPAALGEVGPLDRVAKQQRSLAGHAELDAALLLELARPANADARYFEAIAARYAAAEKKLPPELRSRATERKQAALDTAKAIGEH